MCGIVVYYGDAENRLTRILTGMWAIIYRAPDSTGIGLLGNDLEPLRIRRELGSVENLIDRLMVEPVFDETEVRSAAAMEEGSGDHADFIARRQDALLSFEGYSGQGPRDYPRWSQLTDTETIRLMEPGTPGNPKIQETFPIDSPKSLKTAINRMVVDYDLPLAVVEKLMQQGFEAEALSRDLPVAMPDLFREFRQIFHRYAYDEYAERPVRVVQAEGQKHPYARKYAWQVLRRVIVILPPDFTTDGVTVLFRYLESCMLASHTRDTADRIQQIFSSFWEVRNARRAPRWQVLFQAEKNVNVYGLAAASVMACFQTEVYMKQGIEAENGRFLPLGHVPGPTHPLLLRFMSQPVIGQGRWAIQSSISVKNAHPFMDRNQKRAVVLNGQFDSEVESRLQEYLTRVAGFSLRTDNSTELFAMLWGLYFDTAFWENRRYKAIEDQHRLGLEELSISSQSIDYTIFRNLSGKSMHDIDEMAFIRAVEAMIPSGGQFAVSGISRISPDRLFLAAHKRPIYIVKRKETDDFMVVSDINAALGLFPQDLIQTTRKHLRKLLQAYSKKSVIVEPDFFEDDTLPDKSDTQDDDWFRQEKMRLLAPFRVEIYALDQERIFASIRTRAGENGVIRELSIRDFSGKKRSDIRPEQTLLTPVSFQKDFGKTFYEEHLMEMPGLLSDALKRYTDPSTGLPRFDIRRRIIERRFGRDLASLNRIVLVSTGFSYCLAEIAEKTMEQFFTGVNIIVATPLEISDTFINPDRDLVIMISWSGTTSDMIDAASRMLKKSILMVGITEKPFSDLALVVRKSAGVIPVLSGEEVTVAPLKSAVCLLLTLDLFCLYLSVSNSEHHSAVVKLTGEMSQIPAKLTRMLSSEAVTVFCKDAAQDYKQARLHYIVDAFHDVGAAKAGALNLEVNAWTSMGNALDYAELDEFLATPMTGEELVLVNATTHQRLDKAVEFMKALKAAGRPFLAAGVFSREMDEISDLAERAVILPNLPDYFQPFIDLPFMFLLGFYFGLGHGRLAGEMPRNMAKSVTAGRTKNGSSGSPSDILDDLEAKEALIGGIPPCDVAPAMASEEPPLSWITHAKGLVEAQYYRDLVRLAAGFHEPDPFSAMFSAPADTGPVSRLIFKHLAEDGIIIFVPLDRQAEAGCRNFIRLWEPFLSIPLQVEFPEKLSGVSTEDSLVVAVASHCPASFRLAEVAGESRDNLLWIGPDNGNAEDYTPFADAYGAFYMAQPEMACAHEQVYTALTLLFARVMSHEFPNRARRLENHFKLLLPAVRQVLGNPTLRQRIQKAVQENRQYEKQLFLSGFRGNCTAWQTRLDGRTPKGIESEPFGVSAYHHLVLSDPRIDEKFVRIEPREAMVARYTEREIRAWEKRYLGGALTDDFLRESSMPFHADAVLPFLIDDKWYLPVLKPGYDAGEDCLVVIDATSDTLFDAALDELATFGSRYARLIVITQKGFGRDARLANLKKYPLSHILLVPGLTGTDGSPGILSDFLLPVVVNLVGVAMKSLDGSMSSPSSG